MLIVVSSVQSVLPALSWGVLYSATSTFMLAPSPALFDPASSGAYYLPSLLGILSAFLFYFRLDIGLIPRSVIRRESSFAPYFFIYMFIFSLVFNYPIGRTLGGIKPVEADLLNGLLGLTVLLLIPEKFSIRPKILEDESGRALLLSFLVSIFQIPALMGLSRTAMSLLPPLILGFKPSEALKLSFLSLPAYMMVLVALSPARCQGAVGCSIAFSAAFFASIALAALLLRLSKLRAFWSVYSVIPIVLYVLEVIV